MEYPNYNDYRAMYAKYINRENLLAMLDLVEDYTGKNFMDLCAGDAAATREAFKRGAKSCMAVDQEPSMLAKDLKQGRDAIRIFAGSIESLLYKKEPDFIHTSFDIVFCRQGINYWYTPELMKQLAKWMNEDGVFIFNTFNKKPSRKASVKEYKIKDINFVEISYLVADCIVHHVQVSEGYPPHLTQFKWIDEREFKRGLDPHFDVELRRKNNTDVYICRKK
jgi:SAM-dependent methyltransferase